MNALLTLDQPASDASSTYLPWGDRFLSWFAEQGSPLYERKHSLGSLSYYHFTSSAQVQSRASVMSSGCSTNRKLAAVKCAAESVERQWMKSVFSQGEIPIPRGLRTSNGWAIHQDESRAKQAALDEALERHLLLKSFLTEGWSGFRRAGILPSQDCVVTLLLSKFQSAGKIAGLVVTKSKHYPGVSFGYCLGQTKDVTSAGFWEHAIFESSTKILALDGALLTGAYAARSWISSETKHYLETPFDLAILPSNYAGEPIEERLERIQVRSYDLGQEWGLSFPLHAAFASGEALIPLYHASDLGLEERLYLQNVLARNRIVAKLPNRHPIL